MTKIIPAILTNDEEVYYNQLRKAEHVSSLIQVDLIDGKFADNKTISVDVIKKYPSSSLVEVQLMVIAPYNFIKELSSVEYVSRIIVPFEIHSDFTDLIYQVKNINKQIGLSINPQTPVSAVVQLLDDVDLLLLLAVDPGFSGQKFQDKIFDKVADVKKFAPGLPIEVDGGINFENALKLSAAGVDFLAVNSVIFKANDFFVTYEKLASLVENLHN